MNTKIMEVVKAYSNSTVIRDPDTGDKDLAYNVIFDEKSEGMYFKFLFDSDSHATVAYKLNGLEAFQLRRRLNK